MEPLEGRHRPAMKSSVTTSALFVDGPTEEETFGKGMQNSVYISYASKVAAIHVRVRPDPGFRRSQV
jgi:hypothetical protein